MKRYLVIASAIVALVAPLADSCGGSLTERAGCNPAGRYHHIGGNPEDGSYACGLRKGKQGLPETEVFCNPGFEAKRTSGQYEEVRSFRCDERKRIGIIKKRRS